MDRLGRPYHSRFFKGCLPQISLGPFLNILSHLFVKSDMQILNDIACQMLFDKWLQWEWTV